MTLGFYPTQETPVITREHNEIHNGRTFRTYDSFTLGSAATQDYTILTPAAPTYAHFTLDLDGSAVTQFQVFEGATATGGSASTIWNANRNSVATAAVVVTKGPTVTITGTQMWIYNGGSSTNQSKGAAAAQFNAEWILKANTKYLVRFTSGTASNLCNIGLNWYEATYP